MRRTKALPRLAAEAAGMPVVISFTVETDGRLPTGQTWRAAIEQVDGALAALSRDPLTATRPVAISRA